MLSLDLGRQLLSNFEEAVRKEWIVTNGLGGYASSTVLGINTRKYHGLLVAALNPPRDRRVCLAKIDEEIRIGENVYSLGANEFQNGIFPQGQLYLKEFSVSPFPKYTYAVQDVEVQKTILMPYEKNAVVIIYSISNKGGGDVNICVFPLVNWRHIHSVTDRWSIPWEFIQKQEEKEVDLRLSAPQSVLMIRATNGSYYADGKWIEKLYYREESTREESCLDDCYQLGYFDVDVKANGNGDFAVIAVADNKPKAKILAEMPAGLDGVKALYGQEMRRREKLLARFYEEHRGISMSDWLRWIVWATDMFIVKDVSDLQRTVIAGYHWFEAWGRDTFISLPGLMLVTGRFEDARKVFLTFEKHCRQGLIPNFIPDRAGQPAYNTVDATLWFLNALLQYVKYTNDFEFVQEHLWETLKAIIENHVKGTDFNIRLDADGLLSHGPQLTWMDTAMDGQPITSRAGKAVEIQALWYNALKTMEVFAYRFREMGEAEKYLQMAEKAKESFVEKLWNAEKNCLFDVVNDHSRDGSLRPNQVIAVALDFTIVDRTKAEKVVDTVHRELLTPYGLRTLAKSDPRYVGVYAGNRKSRDRAYHNGTVWPWLLGPFTTAFLKVKGHAEYRREYALRNFLLPLFREQVCTAGLGTIGEIFDGESPHTPRGCISQAWSIAEPLRAYVEDVMQCRPRHEKRFFKNR